MHQLRIGACKVLLSLLEASNCNVNPKANTHARVIFLRDE